jgi:glycosyltransferase involved in cell wall biosynthesis
MPRLDLYQALHPMLSPAEAAVIKQDPSSEDDPNARSYRSGFWATVPIEVPEAGEIELAIRVTLSDGSTSEASLGSIEVMEDVGAGLGRASSDGFGSAQVAIAMATFDPNLELFRDQVESIRAQTMDDWICVVSDDCTPPAAFEQMRSVLEEDDRFILSRSERRLGFYRNFERALAAVPASIPFVAFADQDDRWYPEKLETLLDGLGGAQLVYSDLRVVDSNGRVLAGTYWTRRKNNHTKLASLLLTNTITGAASLFRRELLDLALPFPDPPGTQYHDHWLGLVGLSVGKVAYVDRPLYDYIQHEGTTLGYATANVGTFTGGLSLFLTRLRRLEFRAIVTGWKANYFFAYARLRLLAEVLLVRCAGRMDRGSRRMLRRFARSERSPLGFAWLALRGERRWLGKTETLGAERLVLRGILWRYVVQGLTLHRERPLRGAVYDASLPKLAGGVKSVSVGHAETLALARLIEPLQLSVSTQAPERVNLLIPTLELKHLFGGYITKFNLARKLAEQGVRTRILTIDPTPQLPRAWREQIESYAGLKGMFEQVEIEFARDRDSPVQMNPGDTLLATTWRTAQIAHTALESLRRSRFLYLIQEYEPYTHPMGSLAALAMSTYEYPHVAMFSTELLRRFFAQHSYGVFAAGQDEGERASLTFRNAITAVTPPSPDEMASRGRKRLLFYARPEAHGARNMFELGLMGLAEAVSREGFGPEWEFYGIGLVEQQERIRLAPSRYLELLTRRDQEGYADLLASHDVGLALMCTPHPGLVPIEMASAGMLTVTNSFETKTPEAMSAISTNLITVPPSLEGVVSGLRQAAQGVDDYIRRTEGTAVNWSRDWEDSLNPEVMGRVMSLLAAC